MICQPFSCPQLYARVGLLLLSKYKLLMIICLWSYRSLLNIESMVRCRTNTRYHIGHLLFRVYEIGKRQIFINMSYHTVWIRLNMWYKHCFLKTKFVKTYFNQFWVKFWGSFWKYAGKLYIPIIFVSGIQIFVTNYMEYVYGHTADKWKIKLFRNYNMNTYKKYANNRKLKSLLLIEMDTIHCICDVKLIIGRSSRHIKKVFALEKWVRCINWKWRESKKKHTNNFAVFGTRTYNEMLIWKKNSDKKLSKIICIEHIF